MIDVIKTVQWNIGGAKVRKKDDNAHIVASYNKDGLWDIIALLKKVQPDIITLQEIHADDRNDQIRAIAEALGLSYWVTDFYADSHLEKGQRLGQGIISRFPIAKHDFQLFHNPNYKTEWEDGRKATTHDKGVSSCVVHFHEVSLAIKTLHLIPFKRFRVDPLSAAATNVIADVQTKLRSDSERLLIQGDFNLDLIRIREVLPTAFDNQTEEVPQERATRVNGRRLDHIIFRGLRLLSSTTINSVLTDHYPIVSTFVCPSESRQPRINLKTAVYRGA